MNTPQSIALLMEHAQAALVDVNAFAKNCGIEHIARIDHIGFTCALHRDFDQVRGLCEFESNFIFQSIISGRRIAYVKLKNALTTNLGSLEYLEIADIKAGNSPINKFDHVEIVPVGINYDQLVDECRRIGYNVVEKVRPHHTTHNFTISDGFEIKLSRQPLIDKIKFEEML